MIDVPSDPVARLAQFIHHQLLWLIIFSYALAAIFPMVGLWIRSVNFGSGFLPAAVSLPSALLAFLLFSAGLAAKTDRVWNLVRRPTFLTLGIVANLALPVAFILGIAYSMQAWHNPREVQEILVGLALIASMPIAGSSTAWVQNSGGDLALSIGLVVFSTCLSPITTPWILHAVGWMADGFYATSLHQLAAGEVGGFLAVYVLVPSLAGILVRTTLGEKRINYFQPHLKLASSTVLLTLCYANAAVALPQTVREPDWDFLAVMLLIVIAMCCVGFAAGVLLGQAVRADRPQRLAFMFSLGMTNNGTGLVVAAGALAHLPAVLLPILFYNLVQHVVAGYIDRYQSWPLGPRGSA